MGLLALARSSVVAVPERLGLDPGRFAATGRIRGTGPGVSFSRAVAVLEAAWPLTLRFPFEGSELVGGAAWVASDLTDPADDGAVVKLHWKAGADDLPMHTHIGSSRFIVVVGGRGFFHLSDRTAEAFDGSDVRTIAARRNDVFLFTPGVVHTFSTAEEGMTLLSCHLPYIPLDHPGQYALPDFRWTAANNLLPQTARVAATGWSPLVV
jgi:quercetin dioxygenase-like cupin family protein